MAVSTLVTGTNASTFVEVVRRQAHLQHPFAPGREWLLPFSYYDSGVLPVAPYQIDNNASLGGAGTFGPTIPAAQNNNRLADNVELQLRDGGFTYRGLANTAATETIGKLSYSRRTQYHHSRDERNWHGRGYGCRRFHDGATVDGCV